VTRNSRRRGLTVEKLAADWMGVSATIVVQINRGQPRWGIEDAGA
jgi:hypothetical protein